MNLIEWIRNLKKPKYKIYKTIKGTYKAEYTTGNGTGIWHEVYMKTPEWNDPTYKKESDAGMYETYSEENARKCLKEKLEDLDYFKAKKIKQKLQKDEVIDAGVADEFLFLETL